ncbi:MAG: DUF5050 domain-containing protein [Clostridia bacterium]|nr:DUF5050 domain-containing protein [Clostridia bacterium]
MKGLEKMEETKKTFSLSKKKIIAIIIAVILIVSIVITMIAIFGKRKINGELGNLSNMGLAASGDGAVFYNKYEEGIVKVKGFEEFQITNETAYGINVVGDDVYFLSVGDTSNIAIKKVKTNGNELKTIKTVKTSISKIYVLDNYIYYATNELQDGIAKMKLDGSEERIITASDISDFEVIDGKIYFSNKSGIMYKMNTEGAELNKIDLDATVNNFQIKDSYIYYFNEDDKKLYKVKDDGTDTSIVSEYVNSSTFNITKNKIYFFDKESKKIASINLNGGNYKEIVDISTNNTKINVIDDTIYYLDASKNESKIYQMYRVKTNGGKAKSIEY